MTRLIDFIRTNQILPGQTIVESSRFNTHYRLISVSEELVILEYNASFGPKQKLVDHDLFSDWKLRRDN